VRDVKELDLVRDGEMVGQYKADKFKLEEF
jgi:hypothetical protein